MHALAVAGGRPQLQAGDAHAPTRGPWRRLRRREPEGPSPRWRQLAAAAGLIGLLAAARLAHGALALGLGAAAAYAQLAWALREGSDAPLAKQLWGSVAGAGAAAEWTAGLGSAALVLPLWWAAAVWGGWAPTAVPSDAEAAGGALWAALLISFCVHAALTAIPEELFWRGTVQPALSPRGDHGAGVAATSALFALAHVAASGSASGLARFFPGLWFGALAKRRGRLLAAVICHAAANTCSQWAGAR